MKSVCPQREFRLQSALCCGPLLRQPLLVALCPVLTFAEPLCWGVWAQHLQRWAGHPVCSALLNSDFCVLMDIGLLLTAALWGFKLPPLHAPLKASFHWFECVHPLPIHQCALCESYSCVKGHSGARDRSAAYSPHYSGFALWWLHTIPTLQRCGHGPGRGAAGRVFAEEAG